MRTIVAVSEEKKVQFNLSVKRQFRNRIEELAREFTYDKATQLATEILELYLERWAKLERKRRQWLDEQDARMLEMIESEIDRSLHPPLMKQTPPTSKAQGKKKTK